MPDTDRCPRFPQSGQPFEVRPDPKPERRKGNRPRRIIDHGAVKLARLADRECAACGGQAANGHHVLPKDRGGDDVKANIISLCGSGTSGCHGAHHGSPYTVLLSSVPSGPPDYAMTTRDERRDAEWVNRRIGRTLVERRQDAIDYVLAKLGDQRGAYFLFANYYLEPRATGWVTIEP